MTYISKNKQSFGIVSKDYKKYRGSYPIQLYKLLFSLVNKKSDNISILDLGCGVGNSTEPLLKMAKQLKIEASIFGCDPDNKMLKEARISAKKDNLSISYIQSEAENMPFENRHFDIITSGSAFHWFANKKAMKEIQRVLKDRGVYFVFWKQNIKSKKPIIGHELYKKYNWKGIPQNLRDPKYVKNLFEKNGFSKVKISKTPYREEKTIAETIGLIKTNSTYALLPPKDKNIFIREMTKQYKEALGKRKNVLLQDIHICYGIK